MAPRKTKKIDEVRVSLLPEEKSAIGAEHLSAQKALTVIFVGICIAVSGGIVFLRLGAREAVREVQKQSAQNDTLEKRIAAQQEAVRAVGNIGERIELAKRSLQTHIASELIAEILESSTIPEVYFAQIAGSAD